MGFGWLTGNLSRATHRTHGGKGSFRSLSHTRPRRPHHIFTPSSFWLLRSHASPVQERQGARGRGHRLLWGTWAQRVGKKTPLNRKRTPPSSRGHSCCPTVAGDAHARTQNPRGGLMRGGGVLQTASRTYLNITRLDTREGAQTCEPSTPISRVCLHGMHARACAAENRLLHHRDTHTPTHASLQGVPVQQSTLAAIVENRRSGAGTAGTGVLRRTTLVRGRPLPQAWGP